MVCISGRPCYNIDLAASIHALDASRLYRPAELDERYDSWDHETFSLRAKQIHAYSLIAPNRQWGNSSVCVATRERFSRLFLSLKRDRAASPRDSILYLPLLSHRGSDFPGCFEYCNP